MTSGIQTRLSSARWELQHKDHGLSPEATDAALDAITQLLGYPAPPLHSPIIENESDLTGTVALCLGHARVGDAGATAYDGTVEEHWNLKLIDALNNTLTHLAPKVKFLIVKHYDGSTYGQAMRWLANYLDRHNVDLAVEFHFNSFNGSARGFEYLFWHTSRISRQVAQVFQDSHAHAFPKANNRGIEPLGDQAHERGLLFCKLPKCPSIIAEPFFGDMQEDAEQYLTGDGRESLVTHYAASILSSLALIQNSRL